MSQSTIDRDSVELRPSSSRLVITDPASRAEAAQQLAGNGAAIGHAFANFYAITTRSDAATLRRVNVMKGRPPGQVGSITTVAARIPTLWDWDQLPAPLTRRRVLTVIDTFLALGPFGFRGPAAARIPAQLSWSDDGVRTAQLIAPGHSCPSNDFLGRAIRATGDDLLYITSANRSRHLTGADDSPAHWRAAGLRDDFGDRLTIVEHLDEAAVGAAYPGYLPMSTTILGFHRITTGADGRPHLRLERHGSLHLDTVRVVLDRLGFGLTIGPGAVVRQQLRLYS